MKTIKELELLLNKVVEFNQPNVAQYKGFLYKNSRGYYIKVIDSIEGSQLINDFVYLKDGDEVYITHALKPKLMVVSKNSWHYKLMKFVLKNNAPTPKTMQNGCPYFWLLIFSIIVLPFLFLWKASKWIILFIPRMYIKFLEFLTSTWIEKLEDHEVLNYSYGYNKAPLPCKLYVDYLRKNNYNSFDSEFFDYYMFEKCGVTKFGNKEEYLSKKRELEEKWHKWNTEESKAKQEKRAKEYEAKKILEAKRKKFLEKKAIRDAKWNARLNPIKNELNKLFKSIGNICTTIRNQFKTNPTNWKNIIKRTKQFVGGIITILLLICTYFIINTLVLLTSIVIDFLIAQWIYIAEIGVISIAGGIIYIIVIFLTGLGQNIVNKYKNGKKVWYVEPIKLLGIYVIFYPIKYIFILIAYAILWTIWMPIKFIFYNILWNLFLFPVGKWIYINIKKGVIWLFNNIVGSTGIFGQYVGSSYTDFCPGLEFQGFDDEGDEE